jgi:hypothetical protein
MDSDNKNTTQAVVSFEPIQVIPETPQVTPVHVSNTVSPTTNVSTVNAGINQTPTVPVRAVSKKGFWSWLLTTFFAGSIKRLEVDAQTAQTYAAQHGLTYEANTQSIPTGLDGIGSVMLASYGLTNFHHHLSGLVGGRQYDSIVWFIRKMGSNMGHSTTQMTTVQAGRITIGKSLPSVIVVSKKQGLRQSKSELFSRFTNAQTVNLEGDFSTYFDVYTTASNKVNAFLTLPPNLMELLIQSYQDATIEFVGDSIYLLTESNVTKGSVGGAKQSVVPSDLDTQQARLIQLASFFALTESIAPAVITREDIITSKPVPTIQL